MRRNMPGTAANLLEGEMGEVRIEIPLPRLRPGHVKDFGKPVHDWLRNARWRPWNRKRKMRAKLKGLHSPDIANLGNWSPARSLSAFSSRR